MIESTLSSAKASMSRYWNKVMDNGTEREYYCQAFRPL